VALNPLSYNPQDEEFERAYRLARLTPDEQILMDSGMAQRGMVEGLGEVIRSAVGAPPSQNQGRAQAAQELRALGQAVAPGTEEFYEKAAAIFRKYNMVAEAEAMEQNRLKLEVGKGEQNPALKMQRARDVLAKRQTAGDQSVAPAIAALDRQIAALGVKADGSGANDPEFLKLLNAYEAAVTAEQPERAALIKQAMDAWLKSKAKTGVDITPYQQAMLDLNKAKFAHAKGKDETKATAAREAAAAAVQALVRSLDMDLQNSERLAVHPGLPWITGRLAGVAGRAGAAASNDAAGARALLLNVQAQSFIRALQDLKATSKTGASGLGQLTEKEGDKIQNAKVALDTQQPTEQFKRTLGGYIAQLQAARAMGAQELTKAGEEVPAPLAPIQDRPGVQGIAPRGKGAAARPGPEDAAPKRKLTATRVD